MKSSLRSKKLAMPLSLVWSHAGGFYRVTAWPEARFECRYGEEWIEVTPTETVMAAAAQGCAASDWATYLEFVPREVRDFLGRFAATRMEALQVVARCPTLFRWVAESPALTAFLAAHASLRGSLAPTWQEINAVFERSGIYGILEWLGLPASRQTLTILRNVLQPDLPKRWLDPLRSQLWEPQTIFVLQRSPAITEPQLAKYCHPLAA